MHKLISVIVLLAVLLLVNVGCQGYLRGSLLHPQIDSIAVAPAGNDTNAPQLGPLLQAKLSEQVMQTASARLLHQDQADVLIRSHVRKFDLTQIASAQTRSETARDRDRDAYQAVIFLATVQVEFDVVIPGDPRPVLTSRTVQGTAQFSELPDLVMARQEALERATADAAHQIMVAFTEAW